MSTRRPGHASGRVRRLRQTDAGGEGSDAAEPGPGKKLRPATSDAVAATTALFTGWAYLTHANAFRHRAQERGAEQRRRPPIAVGQLKTEERDRGHRLPVLPGAYRDPDRFR